MKTSPHPTSPSPSAASPSAEILYRFQVEDPRTGEAYFVLMGEDGMAFREAASDLRKAG